MQSEKHILIEKPLYTRLEESEKIIELHKNHPVKATVGYNLRWYKDLRVLKKLLTETNTGNIFHMNLNWTHTFIEVAKWRKDSNLSPWWCMTTLVTHCIDILRWYLVPLCGEIQKIQIITSNATFKSNDENIIISMRFENGSTASITCSILFDAAFSFTIFTINGTINGYDLMGG